MFYDFLSSVYHVDVTILREPESVAATPVQTLVQPIPAGTKVCPTLAKARAICQQSDSRNQLPETIPKISDVTTDFYVVKNSHMVANKETYVKQSVEFALVLQFLLRHRQVSNIALHIMDTYVSGTLLKLLDTDHKIFTDFMGLKELPMRAVGSPETFNDAALYGTTVMCPLEVQKLMPVERQRWDRPAVCRVHHGRSSAPFFSYTRPFQRTMKDPPENVPGTQPLKTKVHQAVRMKATVPVGAGFSKEMQVTLSPNLSALHYPSKNSGYDVSQQSLDHRQSQSLNETIANDVSHTKRASHLWAASLWAKRRRLK